MKESVKIFVIYFNTCHNTFINFESNNIPPQIESDNEYRRKLYSMSLFLSNIKLSNEMNAT